MSSLTQRHEFEETLQNSERQGSLFCCQTCNHKGSDMTQQLKNTNEDTESTEGSGPGWSGERLERKGRPPILWCRSLNPRQGARDFECFTKHCFPKAQKVFSAGERALTEFVLQILLRDLKGIGGRLSLQKPGDQLLQGKACGRHSALGGKRIQKKCPFWRVHANVSHYFSRSLQCCLWASQKWTVLLSISVGSQMTKYLVTSLHG